MKQDKFYQILIAKMHEVAVLPPQTVGPFTPIYKRVVPRFKVYPWKSIAVLSLFGTVFLYFLFGPALVKLASVLQYGF